MRKDDWCAKNIYIKYYKNIVKNIIWKGFWKYDLEKCFDWIDSIDFSSLDILSMGLTVNKITI